MPKGRQGLIWIEPQHTLNRFWPKINGPVRTKNSTTHRRNFYAHPDELPSSVAHCVSRALQLRGPCATWICNCYGSSSPFESLGRSKCPLLTRGGVVRNDKRATLRLTLLGPHTPSLYYTMYMVVARRKQHVLFLCNYTLKFEQKDLKEASWYFHHLISILHTHSSPPPPSLHLITPLR